MRRGHSGIGGWRNDNPRHYRPRSGGTPHFRPPRTYGLMDTPRFPPPGPRPMRGMSYNMHSGPIDDNPGPEQHDRNNYRGSQSHTPGRYQGRSQYPQKQIFPLLQRMRRGDGPEHNPYSSHNYYENQAPQCHINNMGDVDHRQTPKMPPNQESYKQRPSPWVNPPFEDRSYNKPYSHDVEHTRMPTSNYTGHRPPASDHYGGNAGSALDNSNTFSRSVDDTVNIVRKRLLSRESQNSSDNPPPNLTETESKHIETIIDGYSNVRQEHTPKKKIQKQTNVKSNCDQIKNKIVHQLFMMDKDKIHKLMDNPNSSTKFEYAISSLVTESQNSFNRHLRSVAEKSLCGSSTDFINNENNTIYEDTFMKEMQGLLDPQDTVLLEDIKPMVLAELNKVLQLDDFQQRYEEEEQATYPSRDGEYGSYNYENYASAKSFNSFEGNTFYDPNMEQENYDTSGTQSYGNDSNRDHDSVKNEFDNSHLYGRREKRKSSDYNQRRLSTENQQHRRDRKSIDNMDEDKFRRSATPVVPLFDSNADQLSDEEDPFAELDRQYHVAVDHNFIATDDMASPPSISRICTSPVASNNVLHTPQENPFKETPEKSPFKLIPELETPEKVSFNIKKEVSSESKSLYIIKQEIDNQLQSIAKSPLTFSSKIKIRKLSESEPIKTNLTEQSLLCSEAMADETCTPNTATNIKEISPVENTTMKQNKPESKPTEDTDKSESSSCLIKSSAASSSRKRSVDQRPAHRKEKRKKSEPSLSESSKQILNKNIIINVNDCASKTSEKCDTPKSIFNLFFAKEKSAKEAPKEVKKIESDDKGYSEKYVKRKEQRTKSKEIDTEAKKKHDSNSSSHSILSPNSNASSQTPTKPEGQTTLKPIDMFEDLKRKSNVHHARRNTAPTPAPNKAVAEIKFKPLVTSRKISRRHIATQVSRKCVAKETQTTEPKCPLPRFNQNEGRKFVTTAVQTDPVSFKTNINSTDTFERMKEIDLEIQALLQEKFKLYNSLESKETCSSTMQSLGMAVFPLDDKKETETVGDSLSEDAIVDNFTNIPVEELEQIAFESITDEQDDILNTAKPNRRLKVVRQDDTRSSVSPATSTTSTRRKRKGKSPNISLIEQIITDDRPLEDIISLDDLELPPTKSKKKPARPKPKKKAPVKSKANKPVRRVLNYDIKECSVVLTRKDFSKYLTPNMEESKVTEICDEAGSLAETVDAAQSQPIVIQEESNFVEETVVNDIQFDMLDVSEDIIIGDSVELKFSEEKDTTDLSVVISEEIILDNSQSSIEDAGADPPNDDNVCKTYDYSADESLRRDSITVTGNADAVLAIECVENDFIAACLDGNVYHFSGEGQLLNTLRGSNLAVTCLTIVHEKYGTTVYTGSLDSRIRYYDLETGLEKGPECNVLSPIQSMDRAWDTIFVGTRTGFVLQFECKNNMLIPVSTVKFSEQSILALRAMKEGPRKVLLVASRSEPVTIKDAQTGLLLRTLDGPKMTVYTLLFDEGKVYCGTSSHQIHVFDYVSGSHVGLHEGGKGAVCLRATGGLLFAGCYDGCVYIYREGEAKPLAQLRGPGLMLLSLAVTGSKIIAGYKDRSLYIWKIPISILNEMILS